MTMQDISVHIAHIAGLSLIFACVISFITIIFMKWGIIDLYETYRKRWMPPWCEFCFAWWLSVLTSTLMFVLGHHQIKPAEFLLTCLFTPIISLVLFKYYRRND